MALVIDSVIRRHLKAVESFVLSQSGALPVDVDLGDEELVGWYLNPPPMEHTYVVFTKSSIRYVDDGEWVTVPFANVTQCDVPESKTDAVGVRLKTLDGVRFVPFAGRSGPGGKFSDAFALANVLLAVVRSAKEAAKLS